MKTFWLQVIGLLIIIFGALFVTANRGNIPFFQGSTSTPIEGGGFTTLAIFDSQSNNRKVDIRVEIARTKEERAKGLGGRENLASDSGMIFEFEERGKPRFWMKGMLIPLDFIWIDGEKVVDLLPNVQPPQPGQSDNSLPNFAPVAETDKVLEVNAGFIREHNITVGDRIQY